jgi:hypothetical protein
MQVGPKRLHVASFIEEVVPIDLMRRKKLTHGFRGMGSKGINQKTAGMWKAFFPHTSFRIRNFEIDAGQAVQNCIRIISGG